MLTNIQDRQWFIVTRWLQFGAELRVNVIRLFAILVFYSVELANFYGFSLGPIEWPVLDGLSVDEHSAITAIATLWLATSLGLFVCLKRKLFPRWLIFVSATADIVLLTLILIVRDGASSPLVVVYFLILALAATRFSLVLIRYATALTGCSYLYLLGTAKWFGMGEVVPRHQQSITLIAIILTGVVLGQLVRLTRGASDEYARRLADLSKEVLQTDNIEKE